MKILIAGDFAPQSRIYKLISKKEYSKIFTNELRSIIKSSDFSFVNLESPIIESAYKPIPKCGPNLHCTCETAEAIKYAGFSCVTMANNHILDFGAAGLNKSKESLKKHGLKIVGIGDNIKEAERILYLKKGECILAVINCCENEFSIATSSSPGANPLNPIHQYYAIQEAKRHANYVLVIVHGGHEHFQLPSLRMVETYRFFIDAGADAVVNHHQHCFSGYEEYNSKPIFYGIGNFCFDSNPTKINNNWNYGYMVELHFGDNVGYKIHPYNQCGEEPTIQMLENSVFDKTVSKLNDIIADHTQLDIKLKEYYCMGEKYENFCLEPYSGKIYEKLFSISMLPTFVSGKKASFILNHINCESHRDKLIFALKRKNK